MLEKKNNRNDKIKEDTPKVDNIFFAIFKVAILVLLMAFLILSPLLRGMFFEKEAFKFEIAAFALFVLYCIYKWLIKEKIHIKTPLDNAVLLFVLVYLISIISAVSQRAAVSEWLKYCMYVAVFYIISDLAHNLRIKTTLLWCISFTALIEALIGLDAMAGSHFVNIINSWINKKTPLFFDLYDGSRLASTIQYANGLAAYLMAGYFVTVGITVISKRWWQKGIAAAISMLLLFTFLFTFSRGGYLVFVIAAIAYLIIMPNVNRIRLFLYFAGTGIPCVLVSVKIAGYLAVMTGNEKKFWLVLAGGCVASALLTMVFDLSVRWLQRFSWKVYTAALLVMLIMGSVGVYYAFHYQEPVILSYPGTDKTIPNSFEKKVVLEPDNEYLLSFTANASSTSETKEAYYVNICSQNESDILFNRQPVIKSYVGKASDSTETEIDFKVPADSQIIALDFVCSYEGGKIQLDNAKIIDAASGKVIKNLALMYKYLPNSVMSRLEGAQESNSVVIRMAFYKDGLKIFKDHWFTGAGGGAWALLNFSYQSFLYWSTQAHNYFIQVADESGILGIAALIFVILSLLYMYIKRFFKKNENDVNDGNEAIQVILLISAGSLLAHSFLDFDFAITSIFLMFWVLAALFNSGYVKEEKDGKADAAIKKSKKVEMNKNKRFKTVGITSLVCIPVFALLIVPPASFLSAMQSYSKGADEYNNKNVAAAKSNMLSATRGDPLNPMYKMDYALVVRVDPNASDAEKLDADKKVEEAIVLSKCNFYIQDMPNRNYIYNKIAQYYSIIGNGEKTMIFVNKDRMARPFMPEVWQQEADIYLKAVIYYFNNQKVDEGKNFMSKALGMISEAKKVNSGNLSPFIFNPATQETLEKIKFIQNNMNQKVLNIDQLALYSMPGMDIDGNKIPDQWQEGSSPNIKLSASGDTLIAENTTGESGFMQSRIVRLVAGGNYTVEVTLDGGQISGEIPMELSGVSAPGQTLKNTGNNTFTTEIAVPQDFQQGNNVLRLWVTGKFSIKSVSVM